MAQKKSRSSTSSSRTSRSSSKGGKSGAGKPRDGKSGAAGKSGAGKGGGGKSRGATGGAGARKRAATGTGAGKSGGGTPGRGQWRGRLPFDGRVLRILAVAVSITFVVGAVVGLLIGLNTAGSGGRGVGGPGQTVSQEDSARDGRRASEAEEGREPSERYPEGEDGDAVAAGRSGDAARDGDKTLDDGKAGEGGKPPAGERPGAGEKEPPPDEPIPLYVVIDDVGNSLEQLDVFLDLDVPITYAVLPQRPHSVEAARRIARAGHEVILHQPMEAENGMDPGAGAILTSFDGTEIEKRLAENLQSVPGVIGVNNHMGSKVTADEKTMDTVLRYLGGKDLFFLDSRTTARTVGKAIAEKHSVSFAERHVFLDNEPNRDYIRQAVEQGMDVARQRGHAVLIGHVMVTEVAEVLEEMYPFIRDEGFDLHHLSDLVLGPQDDDLWD